MNTDLGSSPSNLIQVGIAELHSNREKSRCCVCKHQDEKEPEPANSSCQQSLLQQAWDYLQSMVFSHQNDCPRCQKRPTPRPCGSSDCCVSPESSNQNHEPTCPKCQPQSQPKSKPKPKSDSCHCVKQQHSTDSKLCKDSVLILVKEYVKKITSEHKTACPLCSQEPKCCEPALLAYLKCMLEQAWGYIKKSCEYNAIQGPPAIAPVCPNPGILKHPPKSSCGCHSSKPEKDVSQKPAICPKHGAPVPRRSEVEGTHEHKSCYTPCCVHNSQGIQPSHTYTGFLGNSSRLSQNFQSHEDITFKGNGFNSSSECDQGNNEKHLGMQGLSLSMKPNDHKFCTTPKDCKHSKQNEPSATDCNHNCSGPCNNRKCPNSEQEVQTPVLECSGTCAKRPPQSECDDEDAEYEAILEQKFAEMVAKKLERAQEVCNNGCNCLTCYKSAHTTTCGYCV
uniref:Uncharacterized protein n=1 Tax=Heliothis virescens TaxID=7102 RepID=A0A2A4K7J2_HELVI